MNKRDFENRNFTDVLFSIVFISFATYIAMKTLVINRDNKEITILDKYD